MNTNGKINIAVMTLLLIAGSLFAVEPADLQINTILNDSAKNTMWGTLSIEGPAWTISSSDESYAIQMSSRRYLNTFDINLESQDEIFIYGYYYDESVVPIIAVYDDTAYFFRDEEGTPLWPTNR